MLSLRIIASALILACGFSMQVRAQQLEAVQIYSDNKLLELIRENKHLSQVVLDECQLVDDIKARATKSEIPSYQFLWGDMLAYGVCIKKDIELGLYYMQLSADQGLPEALEQIGRYYHIGKFMQPDLQKAILYLKEAAILNNLKAQIRLAELYNKGEGSPLDYPELYSLLHHSLTDDKKTHQKITMLLTKLAEKLPERVVEAAKKGKY